jgi:HemY protein
MLKMLLLFLIIGAGIIIGPSLAGQQGMALFKIAGYQLTMSFTTFVIIDLLLFLIVYWCYWLLREIFRAHNIFSRLLQLLFPNQSAKNAEKGLLLLLEGNYSKAEKLFSQAAKTAHNKTLIYLLAAQAAINNNQLITANQLLEQAALTCTDKEKLAFYTVQIRLQIKNNELNVAKHQIDTLLAKYPKNAEMLRLAYRTDFKLENYQAIIDYMPMMHKTHAYKENKLDQYLQVSYIARIQQLARDANPKALQQWWQAQSKAVKNNLLCQKQVAFHFSELGQYAEAEEINRLIEKNKKI